jgi:hypothetical protein
MWTIVWLLLLTRLPPDGTAQLKKVDALMPELRRIARDPALVREVKRQNAQRVPLEAIQKLDTEWTATPAFTPFKRKVLGSTSARSLHQYREQLGQVVAEAFLMDNQGALVGATRRTSDYWQGDEASRWRRIAQRPCWRWRPGPTRWAARARRR